MTLSMASGDGTFSNELMGDSEDLAVSDRGNVVEACESLASSSPAATSMLNWPMESCLEFGEYLCSRRRGIVRDHTVPFLEIHPPQQRPIP